MNLLETMQGKELFDGANATVAIFACPDRVYTSFKEELNIDSAARKDNIPVTRQQYKGKVSAWAEDARADLGSWTQAVYDCAEGMVFKIFAHKHTGHGSRTYNVNQFIRVRKNAAYREIRVQLTNDTRSRFQYATIKGRFDILSLEDAEKRGVKTNPRFKHTFKKDDVNRVMEFIEIEAEKASPVIVRERVIKRKGEKDIVIQKRIKVRQLNLAE